MEKMEYPVPNPKYGSFYIITVMYSPCGYKIRYKLFQEFKKRILTQGLNLVVVECAFPGQNFEVTDPSNPLDIQVRSNSVYWIKESLINIAISRLPPKCKYVAWLDADILFENKNWVDETIAKLETNYIVQMFEKSIWLDQNGCIKDEINSFVYGFKQYEREMTSFKALQKAKEDEEKSTSSETPSVSQTVTSNNDPIIFPKKVQPNYDIDTFAEKVKLDKNIPSKKIKADYDTEISNEKVEPNNKPDFSSKKAKPNDNIPQLVLEDSYSNPICKTFSISHQVAKPKDPFISPEKAQPNCSTKNLVLEDSYSNPICKTFSKSHEIPKKSKFTMYQNAIIRGQPGLCWAARKDILEKIGGLLDFSIMGAGDKYMAYSFANILEMCYILVDGTYKDAIMEWQKRVASIIQGKIDYVGGKVYHYWHGSKQNKQYVQREIMLKEYGFDPKRDCMKSKEGLYEFVKGTEKLQEKIMEFFAYRKEKTDN